jgi:hypothetical protein
MKNALRYALQLVRNRLWNIFSHIMTYLPNIGIYLAEIAAVRNLNYFIDQSVMGKVLSLIKMDTDNNQRVKT